MSGLSSTMVSASAGPGSLVIVFSRWAKNISRSFLAEPGRGASHQEQDGLAVDFG